MRHPWAEEFDALLAPGLEALGLVCGVGAATLSGRMIIVSVQIWEEDGEQVGWLRRMIYPGEHRAVHDRLDLAPAWQRRGLARHVQRAAVAQYDAQGILGYELVAGGVGRYAWARFGVDFASPVEREGYRLAMTERHPELWWQLEQPCTSWEFLATLGRDRMLAGPDWNGVLDLRRESAGRRIFDAYVHR